MQVNKSQKLEHGMHGLQGIIAKLHQKLDLYEQENKALRRQLSAERGDAIPLPEVSAA